MINSQSDRVVALASAQFLLSNLFSSNIAWRWIPRACQEGIIANHCNCSGVRRRLSRRSHQKMPAVRSGFRLQRQVYLGIAVYTEKQETPSVGQNNLHMHVCLQTCSGHGYFNLKWHYIPPERFQSLAAKGHWSTLILWMITSVASEERADDKAAATP